jgi:predicted ATPase
MRIHKIEIENLRGIEAIHFEPDKLVNVIVGPNAIGKTTILEGIRLAKAILAPRYFQESQQALISLGAVSAQFQFFGVPQQLDYSVLARDPTKQLRILVEVTLTPSETNLLQNNIPQLALSLLRTQTGQGGDQAQFALTQFLSSPQGQAALAKANQDIVTRINDSAKSQALKLELIFDLASQIRGSDIFSQVAFAFLDQRLPSQLTLVDYFPADRAFPAGEINVQIGSADAGNQIQSYIGQPAQKYQRLKQTIVHGIITNKISERWLNDEFSAILSNLLPGKKFHSLNINPRGQLKILIQDAQTGRAFDIDHMSSGEKGLILSFLLIRQTMVEGGILLMDEPELHLNPGVCRKIIPFLVDQSIADKDIQVFVCTHSPDILGAAFDRDDSNLFHLRSGVDITKVYRRDKGEMFEALKRLGASTADVLFTRGTIFVEGPHDVELLNEGFFDLVSGYKVTQLGGREEVVKNISRLQEAEVRGEVDKINLLIFDLDRTLTERKSTKFVSVIQWDRYCLENYLLEEKVLFDIVAQNSKYPPSSRGMFSNEVKELALGQLNDVVVASVYREFEPANAGVRPTEIAGKDFGESAKVLVARILQIREETSAVVADAWIAEFCTKCEVARAKLSEEWNRDWVRTCNGKRLIHDLYRKYEIGIDPLTFKKRVIRQMQLEASDAWRVVESMIRNELQ